jgi:hypothetical protein
MRWRIYLLVVLSLASTLPAYAYVDPAAGSLLLQLLLGGVGGLLYFARAFRRKILRSIGFGKEDTDKSSY